MVSYSDRYPSPPEFFELESDGPHRLARALQPARPTSPPWRPSSALAAISARPARISGAARGGAPTLGLFFII